METVKITSEELKQMEKIGRGACSQVYKYNDYNLVIKALNESGIKMYDEENFSKLIGIENSTCIFPKSKVEIDGEFKGYTMDYVQGVQMNEVINKIDLATLKSAIKNVENDLRQLSSEKILFMDVNQGSLMWDNVENRIKIIDTDFFVKNENLKDEQCYSNNISEFNSIIAMELGIVVGQGTKISEYLQNNKEYNELYSQYVKASMNGKNISVNDLIDKMVDIFEKDYGVDINNLQDIHNTLGEKTIAEEDKNEEFKTFNPPEDRGEPVKEDFGLDTILASEMLKKGNEKIAMEKEDMAAYIKEELINGRNIDIDNYIVEGISYKLKITSPDPENHINISSITMIPQVQDMNNQIIFESNNMESEELSDIIKQAAGTGERLARISKDNPAPIVIPLIPSSKDTPYLQQLSRECFDLDQDNKYYRIDEQVVRIIEKAMENIEKDSGKKLQDKIFLNGYSSSGVFAERFALLHPDMVDKACIGGAGGSIPMPSNDLDYPLGTKNYEEIFGEKFDLDEYKKILLCYYEGELETINKSDTRCDDKGNKAPKHDMSYFKRSVPEKVGKLQRELLGEEMFDRANRTVEKLNEMGCKATHTIIPGRTHNDNEYGKGVNELGEEYVKGIYDSERSKEEKTPSNEFDEINRNQNEENKNYVDLFNECYRKTRQNPENREKYEEVKTDLSDMLNISKDPVNKNPQKGV